MGRISAIYSEKSIIKDIIKKDIGKNKRQPIASNEKELPKENTFQNINEVKEEHEKNLDEGLTEEKYKQLYQFYLEKQIKEKENEEVIILIIRDQ